MDLKIFEVESLGLYSIVKGKFLAD